MELNLALEITLVGMGVVFSTLLVLMAIVLLPKLFSALSANRKEPDQVPQQSASAEIPARHLAVIAAAVTAMGSASRIKTIEIIGNDNWERSRYIENTLGQEVKI